jgi:hypothetical protein
VSRYPKLDIFRYWHMQLILNRAVIEESTHEPVERSTR